MASVYFSPFFPPTLSSGVKGSTIPIVTPGQIQEIIDNAGGVDQADLDAVIADNFQNADALATELARGAGMRALFDFRTLISGTNTENDGKPITVLVKDLIDRETGEESASAATFSLLGAVVPSVNGNAFLLNEDTVEIGKRDENGNLVPGKEALSARFSQVSATLGEQSGSISNLEKVVIDPGGVTARAMVNLDVNGYVSGFTQTNNGRTSSFVVLADTFQIIAPNGGTPVNPFTVTASGVKMTNVEVDTITYGSLVDKFNGMGPNGEVLSQLNPSSGFQILPGGFIIQWGQYRSTISSERTVSINFPKPFPNSIMSVSATPFVNSNNTQKDMWIQTMSNRNNSMADFYVQSATANNNSLDGFDWIAFGF